MKTYLIRSIVLIVGLFCFFAADGHAQFGKLKKSVPKKESRSQADVDHVLARVKVTKASFQGATRCLSTTRDVLFDIAATQEKKDQLKAKEEELATTESDAEKERVTIEIAEIKDKEIKRAHKSGELENKKLNKQQLKHMGKSIFNSCTRP